MKTAEEILSILHDIDTLNIKDGELQVTFVGSIEELTANEFLPGTFTNDLFELIQHHIQKKGNGK